MFICTARRYGVCHDKLSVNIYVKILQHRCFDLIWVLAGAGVSMNNVSPFESVSRRDYCHCLKHLPLQVLEPVLVS